jgi:hypothetical protein
MPDGPPIEVLPQVPDGAPAAFAPRDAPHRGSRADPLDPAARHAAQIGPPAFSPEPSPGGGAAGTAPSAARDVEARASLESILPELVKKIAWSGDGKRGSMRLELGAGALAGGTLVVHADGGRVRVELAVPEDADKDAWKAKLHERLLGRGIAVDDLVVE